MNLKLSSVAKYSSLLDFRALMLSPTLWVWLYPVLLIVPNIALMFTELNPTTWMLSSIFTALGLWQMVMGCSRRTGILLLCLIPIAIFGAFQIVLLFLYGNGIIAIDMFLNVVTTNVSEATELLGNLQAALVVVIVLYLPPIVLGIYFLAKHKSAGDSTIKRSRRIACVSLALGVCFAVAGWASAGATHADRHFFPYNVARNLCTAVERFNRSRDYHLTSKDFTYSAHSERPDSVREVYVLVVGETSRAANWAMFGYERPTTPHLGICSNLVGFGKTLTEINTTHKSVPMLISPLTAETFNDSVDYVRSIFAAFNESGYQTNFISNQRRNHSYIDYFGMEAQNALFLTDSGDVHKDMDLVDGLQRVINQATCNKLFVILHCYGSHFEYNKRYEAGEGVFHPDSNSDAVSGNRQELMNAYDNTIYYADAMLDRVVKTLESLSLPSAMIYVSDHGEDIFDDERNRFLHSSPVPTYWQLHVPMIVWVSPQLDKIHPDLLAAARSNASCQVSSSRSVFHTMLHLAGIKTPYFQPDASLMSDAYHEPTPLYLNDYNEALPLAVSGLREVDFAKFDELGLNYR